MVLTHVVEHLGSKKADLNKGKMKQIGEDDEEEEEWRMKLKKKKSGGLR